jgi:glucan biosynthesis protein
MGHLQVEEKPKPVEILFNIIVVWVPFLKPQTGKKLRLSRCSKANWDGRNPNLRTLRVKIAAETLEVGAEVEDETSQGLVGERRVWGNQGQDRSTM